MTNDIKKKPADNTLHKTDSRFNESVEEGDTEKHLVDGEAHDISQNLLGHTHYLQGGVKIQCNLDYAEISICRKKHLL